MVDSLQGEQLEAIGSRAYSGGIVVFQCTWISLIEFVGLYDLDRFRNISK